MRNGLVFPSIFGSRFFALQFDLERVGRTKEEWSKWRRILSDDEPHDEEFKWFGMSKENGLELKRNAA